MTHLCQAGGKFGQHPNYSLPCVKGYTWWEDGTESYCDSCFFCGRLPDYEEG